jgi:hypothetical protein
MLQVIIRDDVLDGVKDPVAYQATLDQHAAQKPLKDWEAKMLESDAKISRALEDLIGAMDKSIRDKIAQETLDAYLAKKQLRSEKP